MATTLPPLLRTFAALLLLTACDTPDKNREADYARERIMDEAFARDIRDIRDRLDKLEAADAVDSKNIDTLFRSRDAIRELQKIEEERVNQNIDTLFKNDTIINANSARPAAAKEPD